MPFPFSTHTLPNGLLLLLSPNPDEPRIYTHIAVRAGSKHDPDRSTGLAHYLEHMLFKGTDKLGTSNWEEEEKLLQQIAETYEAHRQTQDPEERKALYSKIDQLSQQAAAYALPGEYDRIIGQMGARATNAYTWVDQTVFVNDIPAGELERWMMLETERFSRLVLRLFHTELETVYEEFNITQDNDQRKALRSAYEALFKPHPYGTHTTIGRGEDLKAPSHFDIYHFFASHYVPANMAVVLAGDFDPQEAIDLAEKTFGSWQPKEIPAYNPPAIPETQAAEYEVWGQESESVLLHWRCEGAGSREADKALLIAGMLYNQQAGLFDLDLLQSQKVLEASAHLVQMAEYSMFRAVLRPRPGQTASQARDLAWQAIQKLANGDFPDWLPQAVVVDHQLSLASAAQSNSARVQLLSNAFIHRVAPDQAIDLVQRLSSISPEEIQAFAKTQLAVDRCITVFKRQGPDPSVMKVEKPQITPIPLNNTGSSGFAERLLALSPLQPEPVFAPLEEVLQQKSLSEGVELHYLPATQGDGLGELLYVYEFGHRDDPWIKIALDYLEYLGTDLRSDVELRIGLYRLGLELRTEATATRVYIGLTGLDENLQQGVKLLDELLFRAQSDRSRWEALVEDILQHRINERSDKQQVLRRAMNAFARYGTDSPVLSEPSEQELREVDPEQLLAHVRQLPHLPHAIFYYGAQQLKEISSWLKEGASLQSTRNPLPKGSAPRVNHPEGNRVWVCDFPMVQVEVLAVREVVDQFSSDAWILGDWFNQYYGLGLSSVMFQELRESRALAYSTYAYAESPARMDGQHWLQSFIGTQPDKLSEALSTMQRLLSDWQFDGVAAERVRQGMLRQMASQRDLRQQQYWLWRQAKDRGLQGNPRKLLYETLQRSTLAELREFCDLLASQPTTYCILGPLDRINLEELSAFGEPQVMKLEDFFERSSALTSGLILATGFNRSNP